MKKAWRIYGVFYGLLLFAFFIVAMSEACQGVQKRAGTVSQEVLVATATLNGLLGFFGKAVLSPLRIVTLLIFLWLRYDAKHPPRAPE